jgi:uncharacterized protein (TIGR03437 family)
MNLMRLRLFFAVPACLAAVCAAQSLPSYTIAPYIGTGQAGYEGDNGAASNAKLNFPMAITRAANGTLYIADTFNHRIRTVQPDGIIRSIVGTGNSGFSGDTATAAASAISSPYGVAVDSAGNLYFSDTRNNIVRRVSSTGTMTRFAGTGAAGYRGDGEPAVNAWIRTPTGVAVDAAGNVYFSDTANNRVRKVLTNGQIGTFAGTGQASYAGDGGLATEAALWGPTALALDSAGNLYIADTFNHCIRKVDTLGVITTVAGDGLPGFSGDGGPATKARLNTPRGVSVDAAGNIWIADTYNNRIRVVTENGVIQTVAGSGFFGNFAGEIPANLAEFRYPRAVLPAENGTLLVLDSDNHRIMRLTPQPQAPMVNGDGVLSLSAFGGFRAAARGGWLEIYGSNLALGTRAWSALDFDNGKAPTSLSGTSVTIGGQPAFVAYVSPGQVNVQVPDSLPAGTHDLVVHTPLGSSAPYRITVHETLPGLFAPPEWREQGRQYVGALQADGSLAGNASHPLRPGDIVTLYGIGFGPVAPNLAAGEPARGANSVVLPLRVYFGDTPAAVAYAGLAPGTLGLYQISVVVPAVPGSDAIPLRLELNGAPASQTLFTAVR